MKSSLAIISYISYTYTYTSTSTYTYTSYIWYATFSKWRWSPLVYFVFIFSLRLYQLIYKIYLHFLFQVYVFDPVHWDCSILFWDLFSQVQLLLSCINIFSDKTNIRRQYKSNVNVYLTNLCKFCNGICQWIHWDLLSHSKILYNGCALEFFFLVLKNGFQSLISLTLLVFFIFVD